LNHKLAIVAFVLALTAGALIYQPISGSSSASDSPKAMPPVYLAEIEGDVCVSDSPVHTTVSLTAADVDSELGEGMPNVYLVMMEEGVCASLSPISTPARTSFQGNAEPQENPWQAKAPGKLKEGVWYVQN